MNIEVSKIKAEINRLELKQWPHDHIVKTLSYKYKIRRSDIEIILYEESKRKTDTIEGWLMRREGIK